MSVPAQIIRRRELLAWAMCSVGAVLSTCSGGGPKSSRLETADIEFTARELAAKLSASDFLRERTADSPRITIAITRVENLSADVIPEADRWYLMARVRDSQGVQELLRLRNVVFLLPAVYEQAVNAEVAPESTRPTHEMLATLHSSTRSAGRDRTDAYLCEMRITRLDTGEVVWSDIVEFKKTAFGKSYD
jgi:hypothetical protein